MWNDLKKSAQDALLQEALDFFGFKVEDDFSLMDLQRRGMQIHDAITTDNRRLDHETYEKYKSDENYTKNPEYKNRWQTDQRYLDIINRRNKADKYGDILKQETIRRTRNKEEEHQKINRPIGERNTIMGLPKDAILDTNVKWWMEQQKFDLKAQFEKDNYDQIEFTVEKLAPPVEGVETYEEPDRWGDMSKYRYDTKLIDKDENIINKEYVRYNDIASRDESNEKSETTIWRGMSGNEFVKAVKDGFFQSSAWLNLSGQEKVTCFGDHMSQAFSYAAGFAPWYAQPTFEFPSYVIEMDRPVDAVTNRVGEVEVAGRIPVQNVKKVYEIRLAKQRASTENLVYDRYSKRVDSRGGIGSGREDYLVRVLPENEWKR